MEEEGIGEVVLFHTRCVVNERRVNLTIDESTAVNMVSIEVVEKLGLKMTPLERPYTLKWFEDVFSADWKNRLLKRREQQEERKEEVDAPTEGLNLLVQKVQDGDAKGQRWSVFKTQCMIKDRACKMIIDGGSFTDAISKDVVHALGLSMWRHPQPHHVEWLYNSKKLKITHKVRVKFTVGD